MHLFSDKNRKECRFLGDFVASFLRKPKRMMLALLVIGGSALYTHAFHTLDVNFLWKSLGILLPIQVGASVYFLYLYWSGRIPGTSLYAQQQQERQLQEEDRPL